MAGMLGLRHDLHMTAHSGFWSPLRLSKPTYGLEVASSPLGA